MSASPDPSMLYHQHLSAAASTPPVPVSLPQTSERALGLLSELAKTDSEQLLIVNFEAGGHHHAHVCHLVRFATTAQRTEVRFLVGRKLRDEVLRHLSPEQAAFFVERVRLLDEDRTWQRVHALIPKEQLAIFCFVELLNLRERRRSKLLFLHLESAIYLLAFSPLPRFGISGLLSRPTFHYKREGFFIKGTDNRALFLLKYAVARALCIRRGFDRIFLMDPWAQEHAARIWRSSKFHFIPDPYGPEPGDERIVASGEPIAERPMTLLIAGAIAPRKGVHSLANALAKVSPQTRRNVRVYIVGKPEKGQEEYVATNLQHLKDIGVDVRADIRFVEDEELDRYISDVHVVLTPYINFKSSSGILYRAAHFGTPVVSTNRGLIGRLVIRHRLGAAIDTTDPAAFAHLLDEIVATGRVQGFDPVSARRLADDSTPTAFAGILLGATGESAMPE